MSIISRRRPRVTQHLIGPLDRHQTVVNELGGTLIYAALPPPEWWDSQAAKYAPGCGTPTAQVLLFDRVLVPCGANLHLPGQVPRRYFCQYCQPK